MPSTQRAPSSRPVLIAGAGPVGLTAALNLARQGIPVIILEAGGRIADDPRAGTIHPPTLELFATVGMTDAMLDWQTARFTELAVGGTDGHVVVVRPEQVVEIAFDGVQASSRYPGGLALRFARVVRYRDDKSPAEADTIDNVRALY